MDLTNHGEEAAGHPDDEAEVDTAGGLEDPGGGYEDAAADDAAHDDGAAIEEGQLCLHAHPVPILSIPCQLLLFLRRLLLELEAIVPGADQLVTLLRAVEVRPLHHVSDVCFWLGNSFLKSVQFTESKTLT